MAGQRGGADGAQNAAAACWRVDAVRTPGRMRSCGWVSDGHGWRCHPWRSHRRSIGNVPTLCSTLPERYPPQTGCPRPASRRPDAPGPCRWSMLGRAECRGGLGCRHRTGWNTRFRDSYSGRSHSPRLKMSAAAAVLRGCKVVKVDSGAGAVQGLECCAPELSSCPDAPCGPEQHPLGPDIVGSRQLLFVDGDVQYPWG